MRRTALLLLAVCVLAACETPQKAPPAPGPAPDAPGNAGPPPAPPPVVPPPPTGPVSPAAQLQAQKTAQAAVDLLQSGNEESALAEVQRALAFDPQNKLALSLAKQMAPDALSSLPREWFAYTVRPSDSLSGIAQRFLGDVYSFYILARYNDIKVPKQLAAGQVIRIPGKAPPPGSPPPSPPRPSPPPAAPTTTQAPAPAPAPLPPPAQPAPEPTPGERAMQRAAAFEKSGDLVRARAEYQNAAGLGQPNATAKAESMRARLVSAYTSAARAALARQDLDGTIANWSRVVELDPDNSTASLELQRARKLKENFDRAPK